MGLWASTHLSRKQQPKQRGVDSEKQFGLGKPKEVEEEEEEEDNRREAAIASTLSLQPNFKPVGVTPQQLSKLRVRSSPPFFFLPNIIFMLNLDFHVNFYRNPYIIFS